jgi:periplasmic protein TonB
MSFSLAAGPDVFTFREIAKVAGVSPREVRRLFEAGEVPTLDRGFVGQREAVRAVGILRGDAGRQIDRGLFRPRTAVRRPAGRALATSGALHAAMLAAIAFLTSLGISPAHTERPPSAMRLVFLPLPGPGGGGGGGGGGEAAPPPKAELKGPSIVKSPVPPPRPISSRRPDPEVVRRPPPPPPRPEPVAKPVEPPPPRPEPTPQVVAPVATAPADTRDRAGVLSETPAASESNGPGSGGGAGTGKGTGLGEGDGAGIGPGTGGGTGGGPYRPGSGITPPSLLHEVRPDYTDDARRRGISGDVVLEIVVRSNGTVGEVKILQGLGAGLDQKAVEAVRAWRFAPAKRFGTPVDVLVEVAVEFKLR